MLNKKNKLLFTFLFLIIGLTLVIATGISEKDLNPDKYQEIVTDNVIFELPTQATHYWTDSSGNNDLYEIIISNLSIRNNSDYILKISWNDNRYIRETLQIHYEFIDGILSEENIRPISLEAKSPQLSFNNFKVELGTIEGYEEIPDLNGNERVSISIPIYSWEPYREILVTNIQQDFTAIDDVGVDACGTLNTANGRYVLTQSIYQEGGDCMIIGANNVTLDLAGYSINGTSDNGIKILNWNNTVIKNGDIRNFSNNIFLYTTDYNSDPMNTLLYNLTINSYTTASKGILVIGSSSNNYTSIDAQASSADGGGIYLDEGDNTIVRDCNFSNYYMQNSDNILFINTTFNHSSGMPNGDYTRKWYFDVEVNNSEGYLENAAVNITNISNANILSIKTDATGSITRYEITEYMENATGKYFETPHIVNITLSPYTENETLFNITSSKNTFFYYVLEISDITPPNISIISPLNSTYDSIRIEFNISANEALSWCGLSLDNSPNITMLLNGSSTGANFSNATMTQGNHFARFSCNDSLGNMNASVALRSFRIDTLYPTVNVTYPINGTTYSFSGPINLTLNVSAEDASGIDTMWYNVQEYGGINYSFTNTTGMWFVVPEEATYTFTINVYVNDTFNHINSTQKTLFIKQLNPLLGISGGGSPSQGDIIGELYDKNQTIQPIIEGEEEKDSLKIAVIITLLIIIIFIIMLRFYSLEILAKISVVVIILSFFFTGFFRQYFLFKVIQDNVHLVIALAIISIIIIALSKDKK